VIQSASKIKHVKKKVIVGDSHARTSAAEFKHCLDSSFAISSFVKPGAGMRAIVDTVKEDIKKLIRNDVVVIWGGSNDIGKNNSREALKHLCNFVKNNQMVNTVVMTSRKFSKKREDVSHQSVLERRHLIL
jgi:1-aminocyclopropane-1-carboxylate deaminase/D-cysteine desulfhydrase-like pyridoxal-dependent ACC family enzyme